MPSVTDGTKDIKKTERIQKIISDAGITSRRKAEEMIINKRVLVNGVDAYLGQSAIPGFDEIKVDGKSIPVKSRKYYLMLNKPLGYITSSSDDFGRSVVLELVSEITDIAKIYPVGRLDMDSEGLLLLTNDGQFANRVMHPRYNFAKTYVVHVRGNIDIGLGKLSKPLEIDSRTVIAISVKLLKSETNGGILEIKIGEGRNRQIRKMCGIAGLDVMLLKRTEVGPFKLGNLPVGKWRHLTREEIALVLNAK